MNILVKVKLHYCNINMDVCVPGVCMFVNSLLEKSYVCCGTTQIYMPAITVYVHVCVTGNTVLVGTCFIKYHSFRDTLS